MFREKEQISDIVIATKVALKTKNKIDYLPFEYEKIQNFYLLKINYSFLKEAIKLKLLKNGISIV